MQRTSVLSACAWRRFVWVRLRGPYGCGFLLRATRGQPPYAGSQLQKKQGLAAMSWMQPWHSLLRVSGRLPPHRAGLPAARRGREVAERPHACAFLRTPMCTDCFVHWCVQFRWGPRREGGPLCIATSHAPLWSAAHDVRSLVKRFCFRCRVAGL